MKKLIYLFILTFLLAGCSLFNGTTETSTEKTYAAEVHVQLDGIETATNNARYLYTYSDVDYFTVTLTGEDMDGKTVAYNCGENEYYYIEEDNEVVVKIEKAGFYKIELVAFKKFEKRDLGVATGESGNFIVRDGDIKTINISVKYGHCFEKVSNTLYRLYNIDVASVKIVSVLGARELKIAPTQDYIDYLHELAKEKECDWWDLWGTEPESDLDLDYTQLFIETNNDQNVITGTTYEAPFKDMRGPDYTWKETDEFYKVYMGIFTFTTNSYDENAYNIYSNKLWENDFVQSWEFHDYAYIYVTNTDGETFEVEAFHNTYENLKEPIFRNVIDIDFADASSGGEIHITW